MSSTDRQGQDPTRFPQQPERNPDGPRRRRQALPPVRTRPERVSNATVRARLDLPSLDAARAFCRRARVPTIKIGARMPRYDWTWLESHLGIDKIRGLPGSSRTVSFHGRSVP